jgi:HSP20 family molecular chaperone IbpA
MIMAEKTVPQRTDKEVPATREETREASAHLHPPVDIYETNDGLVVVADMPGVAKEDVDVSVDNGVLTIEGRTQHVAAGNPIWSEYRLLNFYRQFELSEVIDQESIAASLKQGVLTLRLPKAEKAKPKQIAVNVG